jgi:hypothetical protein
MSAYRRIQVEFKNEEALRKALEDWCQKRAQVTGRNVTFEQAQGNDLDLYGYKGKNRGIKAKYVIRRGQFNRASNDLGFAQKPDGTFEVIISEYDSNPTGESDYIRGADVLQYVKQRYAYHQTLSVAQMQGYTVTESMTEDGTIQLQLARAW